MAVTSCGIIKASSIQKKIQGHGISKKPQESQETFFVLFLFVFLLDIFFIYIANVIMKVAYTLAPPFSPNNPLLLLGPGVLLYWGI
jgi:hypothetical protein